ncbi:MAG: sn-glycerol-3-phosphate ABC transporter ATP-binding protein UgpC [Burkholderiales bacterium]|nr:sn-glycerol-3-phosphate ABC transporter ATP-binding protein UgpC [Burkholderiales bacterium]
MASVKFKGITKRYTEHDTVVNQVSLDIADGEFVVLVGPSGCGKSTMLRMVAGLEEITDGELHIGDEVANDVPAAKRGIAMVFQSYALYPHMTVEQNMGFALKLAKTPKAEIARRVAEAADILKIAPLLKRKPRELSGGQRQRVAIGRAIVRKPKVFLFDEPLSNLDASLRLNMRVELSKLHHTLKTTMIYVTHDQVEAMTLADRIVVFDSGVIQGIGTPKALYDNPPSLFVAGFLGSPSMNLFAGHLSACGDTEASVKLPSGVQLGAAVDVRGSQIGDPVTIGIRPEHIRIANDDEAGTVRARVALIEYLGDCVVAYVELVGSNEGLSIKLPGQGTDLKFGDEIRIALSPRDCLLFDRHGQAFARHAVGTA